MYIRDYQITDFDACRKIFLSNTPKYFDMADLSYFEKYLQEFDGKRFVVENQIGEVIACGGYWINNGIGRLSFGMVKSSYHGRGVGKFLTQFRISKLLDQVQVIEINTSQRTEKFYSKNGFKTFKREHDAHGPGLDSVQMRLEL